MPCSSHGMAQFYLGWYSLRLFAPPPILYKTFPCILSGNVVYLVTIPKHIRKEKRLRSDDSVLGDDSIVLLVVLVCMVVMSAYFSATETAFTSLNRIRLKSRADNGDARAARVLALAEKYDLLLSTILIGNNIVNNVATTLSAVLFAVH